MYNVGMGPVLLGLVISGLQEVNEKKMVLYVTRRKATFHAKVQVHCSHGLPVFETSKQVI